MLISLSELRQKITAVFSDTSTGWAQKLLLHLQQKFAFNGFQRDWKRPLKSLKCDAFMADHLDEQLLSLFMYIYVNYFVFLLCNVFRTVNKHMKLKSVFKCIHLSFLLRQACKEHSSWHEHSQTVHTVISLQSRVIIHSQILLTLQTWTLSINSDHINTQHYAWY